MSFKNMNICIMNNETQYDKEYNNISTHLTKKLKLIKTLIISLLN